MKCSWIISRESGTPCYEVATPYMNFELCAEHINKLRDQINQRVRSTALQTSKYHALDQFPGLCYIVLLPNGYVKIGYSNTTELLNDRYKSLSRKYEAPVVPLVVIQGGFVAEAVLHEKFREYRLPGVGEVFEYSPELAEYIASVR